MRSLQYMRGAAATGARAGVAAPRGLSHRLRSTAALEYASNIIICMRALIHNIIFFSLNFIHYKSNITKKCTN